MQVKGQENAILSLWQVEMTAAKGERKTLLVPIALGLNGLRSPLLEKKLEEVLPLPLPFNPGRPSNERVSKEHIEPALFRELAQRSRAREDVSYSTKLIGWVEVEDGPKSA